MEAKILHDDGVGARPSADAEIRIVPPHQSADILDLMTVPQMKRTLASQANLIKLQAEELAELRPLRYERRAVGRAPLDWATLESQSPPERDWAIRGWLPQGHVTLLAGRGGIGKTRLAQSIASHLCTMTPYIDDVPRSRRVLCWFGEDDASELWRRQADIAKTMATPLADFADLLFIESHVDRDMTLAAPVYGTLEPTPLMAELAAQVLDYRADYVWLDSLARIFGGSENDRHQVTQFVAWLTAAAGKAGVGLIGHPGKAAGSEYSGSTAWEGSVRARLYLGNRLPDQEQDDDGDADVLYLSRRKSNYSDLDWRRLRYVNGVLIPEAATPARHVGGEFAIDVVLRAVRKLSELGMYGNSSTRSPEYLPKLATDYEFLDGMNRKQFSTAMRDAIKTGRLKTATVGQYSNRTPKSGLTEVVR
jgi:hypothetical protein